MIDWLIRRFVKGWEDVGDVEVRGRYGVFAGALGIGLNFLLFLVKLPVGIMAHSMAIISDAFNNLSDMGSSVISLLGMKMSARRPDAQHPFGHGRYEYISALMVAVLIIFMAVELIRESVPALFEPEVGAMPPVMIVVMLLSIGVKLWMMRYNAVIGERIHAGVILAAAQDSRNDVITTAAVLIAALIRPHVALPVDALVSLAVALMILKSGIDIARETVDQLLGERPDADMVSKISALVLQQDGIVGIHDMLVHDYGPGRTMASVHAEVSDKMDIYRAHEIIDAAEMEIKCALGIPIVIHMDPVAVGDTRVNLVRGQLERTIAKVDQRMSMHDFRMVSCEGRVNLMFDLVMPFELDANARQAAIDEISACMQTINPDYHCLVQEDMSYSDCG